jgi:glycosyltransferase involved in cell wall biosynthesis
MKLSILVPIYNEEKTIGSVLLKLANLKLSCEKEIIVINDGSRDDSEKIIKNVISTDKKHIIKYVHHSKNSGKGASIRSGIMKASGNYILIQDADFEYNPNEIPKLIQPVLNKSDKKLAVYGSRFKNNKAVIPFLYLLGNKFLTFITNLLCGWNLTDMETGYKLIPACFLKNIKLESFRFDIEPEITMKLFRQGYKIVEIPISYQGRSHFAGKKLTPIDAIGALKALIKFRF